MHICLVAVEIFAWGKYGGFGRATRTIGRELAKRGFTVSAVVPRRAGQPAVADLDGIQVHGLTLPDLLSGGSAFRQLDIDIFHSQEPSLGTYLAIRAQPLARHVVTFRDTRDAGDWRTERALPSMSFSQVIANRLYEDNWLVHGAVRRADRCFVATPMLAPKAREKYALTREPEFLPTPVPMPDHVEKASTPTVCFVARWDRRKRPEQFFELARAFPNVRFLAAGKSRDAAYERALRRQYGHLPNVDMLGFIDQFQGPQLSQLLGRSWILVNTAAREGLPTAFVEAAAHGCAILSAVNPECYASRFGYHVTNDDFKTGLSTLLDNERWRELGQAGRDYVHGLFALEPAIERHIRIYHELLAQPPGT